MHCNLKHRMYAPIRPSSPCTVFYWGFAFLPLLWFVNVWLFWYEFRGKHAAADPDIKKCGWGRVDDSQILVPPGSGRLGVIMGSERHRFRIKILKSRSNLTESHQRSHTYLPYNPCILIQSQGAPLQLSPLPRSYSCLGSCCTSLLGTEFSPPRYDSSHFMIWIVHLLITHQSATSRGHMHTGVQHLGCVNIQCCRAGHLMSGSTQCL